MKKRRPFIFGILMLAFCLSVAGMGMSQTANAAGGTEYVPVYEAFREVRFEGLSAPSSNESQYIWDNTNCFWVEGNAATILNGGDAISGNASLVWTPVSNGVDGWSTNSSTLGISNSKIVGIEGGYMIKLTFKVRLSDVSNLVVAALNPTGDAKLQETSMNANYARVTDPGMADKDEETVIDIQKVGEGDSAYGEFSFAFRGPTSFTPYFKFTTLVSGDNPKVIIDDVVLYRESQPILPYYNYENFITENAESAQTLSDTIFTGARVNVSEEKSGIVSDSEAIQGNNSIKLMRVSAGAVTLNSKQYTLPANNYKLYYKFAYDKSTLLGIYVKNASNDEVIYDYIFNCSASERKIEYVNPLFDSSNHLVNAAGVHTVYGEFEITEETEIYIQLTFTASSVSGYAIYDDVNILRAYEQEPAPTQGPVLPTAPSGRVAATYADIDAVGASSASVLDAKNETLSAVLGTDVSNGKAIAAVVACILGVAALAALGVYLAKSSESGKRRLGALALCAVMAGAYALAGCGGGDSASPSVDAVPAGYTVVYPEKIDGKLDNPGMGWVLLEEPTYGGHADLGNSGTFPEVDNISIDTSWAHLEPEEGVYDWAYLDRTVEYWSSVGKHVNFRISTDTLILTYTYKGVPDWLVEKYNVSYEVVPYTDPGPIHEHKVYDLSDKNYLECLDRFLAALCERYKDNKYLDTVEIRGFGVWGEWHTGYSFESKEDRMISLYEVIQRYMKAFEGSGKTMVVSAAWDPKFINNGEYTSTAMPGSDEINAYMNYVTWSAFDQAWRTPGLTFRRDSGGALLYHQYDEKLLYEAFRSGKRIPLYGEYATGYANLSDPNNRFDLIDGINDILYKMRANYSTMLGWVNVDTADLIANRDSEFINRGNDKLGYRLAVDWARFPESASAGATVDVTTSWSNSSVGIFPYASPLTFSFVDANGEVKAQYTDVKFDARTFVQGEINNVYSQVKIPDSLADGTYKLCVSLETEDFGKIALGMAGEIASDARIYSLGEITVASGVKVAADSAAKTNYGDIANYTFEPNTTYEITFRYLPGMDVGNFYFDQNYGYEFFLRSASDESDVCGFYKWQDVSGEIGQKTVHFTTGNKRDYKLTVESDSFDTIKVGDIWIEKVGGVTETFEDYSILTSMIAPVRIGTGDGVTSADGYTPISGKGSFVVETSASNKGVNGLAKVYDDAFKFTKGRTYTVSFDFKPNEDVAPGGYYLIGLADKNISRMTDPVTVIGEWYEREDGYTVRRAFTFTPEEDDLTLVFGMKHGGTYLIDNVTVTEYWAGDVIKGEDVGYKHNVIPVLENVGFGHVETFESGSFAGTGFEWGQFAWGRMTFDKNEVINYEEGVNEVSLLGRVEAEAYDPLTDTVWFEFARTKRTYYPFEAGKTYDIEFDYKVLKQFNSGKIFIFFRGADGKAVEYPISVSGDSSYKTTADLSAGVAVGQVVHYKARFTLGASNSYQFMICLNGLWEMSLDNFLVTEVTE